MHYDKLRITANNITNNHVKIKCNENKGLQSKGNKIYKRMKKTIHLYYHKKDYKISIINGNIWGFHNSENENCQPVGDNVM